MNEAINLLIHTCRREALSKWKSGLGSAATYRALMVVFVKAGRMDCAKNVVQILKEGAETTDELPPQPGATETPG
jgi:F0F1-type ATP synthase epsilon subunit